MKEQKKENHERSLIEGSISLSKRIIVCKAALYTNRETQFFINRIPPFLPSQGYLKEIEMELSNRIDEYEIQVAKYLKQILLLNGRKDIVESIFTEGLRDKFHFSSKDLKDGYVCFHKNAYSTWITGVLVLGKFEGESKHCIEPGRVLDFNDVRSNLVDIQSVLTSELIIHHAIRKIKQNGKE